MSLFYLTKITHCIIVLANRPTSLNRCIIPSCWLQDSTVECQHGVPDKHLHPCMWTNLTWKPDSECLSQGQKPAEQRRRCLCTSAMAPTDLWPLTSDPQHPAATELLCVPIGLRQDVLCWEGHSTVLPFPPPFSFETQHNSNWMFCVIHTCITI